MKKSLLFVLLALFSHAVLGQEVVTGTVKDASNAPVEAATVLIKGTNIYSITDQTGTFSVKAPKQLPFTLRISAVGYQQQEIEVFELTGDAFDVILIEDNL